MPRRSHLSLLVLLLSAPAWASAPRIAIDPGHGGTQEGALGAAGVLEKNLALEISRRLKVSLEKTLGAKAFLTRERDVHVPLSARVALANRQRADLLISIHANSMPTRKMRAATHGVETYFLSASASDDAARKVADRENSETGEVVGVNTDDTLAFILADLQRSEAHVESSKLAYQIHQELVARSGANDRGVHQAPFFVLMGVEAPSVLVEVGYISHPSEGKRLLSVEYQQTLVDAIVAGVKRFLETRDPEQLARP